MSAVKRYFKPLFTAAPSILWAYFSWMKYYSLHPNKKDISYRYRKLHKLIAKVTDYLNGQIIVEGLENVNNIDTNFCLIGNHISDFDPLAIMTIFEKPVTFVGKIETLKYPFIGTALKSISGAFIKRDDLKQTLKVMMRVQKEMEEEKKNWCIFAEGTRLKDSSLKIADMHPGTFRVPMKAKIPIVPFAIIGSDRIFKSKPIYKKYPIHIKFLKPITYDEYKDLSTEVIAKYVQNQIQKTISFDLRRKDFDLMKKINGNKYNPL